MNFPEFSRSVFLFLDDLVAKLAVSLRYFHSAFPISRTLRFDAQLLYRILSSTQMHIHPPQTHRFWTNAPSKGLKESLL